MYDVAVIEDSVVAGVALDPMRVRLLAELGEPASAATLASRVRLPRQKVNYHLRELERHGLVELVGERRKGNMTERLLQATARSYVISPAALAPVAPDPSRSPNGLSARWLLALGAQLVRDVGALISGAAQAGKRAATLGLETQIRFASASDRAAFAEELTAAIAALVSKYHDEKAERGRNHRLVVGLYPMLKVKDESERAEV